MSFPWKRKEIECTLPDEELERTDLILEKMEQIAKCNVENLRIQYVSDLHLEFLQNRSFLQHHPLEVAGDILLVAGDTAYLDTPESGQDHYSKYEFWDWVSEHYEEVIVCFGNHDFYGYYDLASIPDGYIKEIRKNVHAYYNAVVSIRDVDIIVSTLWSKISPENAMLTQNNVSDFYRIMYNGNILTSDNFNSEHDRCFKFITKAVSESKASKKIVLTHHVPTELCVASEFKGSSINGAFTVELGNYIVSSNIDYWIYGHSHRSIDAQIGKTTIVSNQLGYVSHREYKTNGFDPSKFIEL